MHMRFGSRCALFTAFVLPTLLQPASAAEFKPYPDKTMKIVYEMKGSQQGKKTWLSGNYGAVQLERIDAETKVMGISNVEKKVTRSTVDWIETVDLVNGTRTKMKNPMAETLKSSDPAELGKSMLRAMGGKETDRTRTILNRECKVWILSVAESCIWNNYTLATSASMAGIQMEQIAVEIVPDAKLSDADFELPAGKGIAEKAVDPMEALKNLQNRMKNQPPR